MKMITLLLLTLISLPSFAGELDGRKFCRTVDSGGSFGQPAGTRSHCVSFADDKMTDNANTFFGNHAETINYVLVDSKILVVRGGNLKCDYIVQGSSTQIANSAGALLNLVK